MSKFRVGDRVVRTSDAVWMAGAVGTIIGITQEKEYRIKLDQKFEDLFNTDYDWAWNENYIELESVVNSPLYQLMKENDV